MNDEVLTELGVQREELQSAKAAEVGNIFTLGTKYSAPLGLVFNNKDGERKTVLMGCYGIGVSRVMGVIAEKFCDEHGLVWPEQVAPYKYYLIGIGEEGTKQAEILYLDHENTILYDDRNLRPGEKFADAELMGIPYRVVISDKTLASNQAEITNRATGESKLVDLNQIQF